MATQNKPFQFAPFLIHLGIPLAIGAIGGLFTLSSINTWYPGIIKPSFNPPNWVFGPVWTILYILIGISAYRVWQKRKEIPHYPRTVAIYLMQLLLNLMWSFLFFYAHRIEVAMVEILILLIVIVINGRVFYKIDKIAGLLFIPYALWVSFAMVLTYTINNLNP